MRGMLGNRRLLERAGAKAVIQTSDLSSAGHLNPEQSDRFIDYIVDQSVMLKDGIRVRRMNADRADVDKLSVGTRIIRKATEGTEPGAVVGISASKRQLSVTEIILPADVTFSFIEDNIERDNFEDHMMQVFGVQLSNDLEDLAINGVDGDGDPFIGIEAGWLDLLKDGVTGTTHVTDTNGGDDYRNVIFEDMLGKMPNKFKANKQALRYYVSVTAEEKYRFQLGQRQTAGGDVILQGGEAVRYSGIAVVPVPYMPDGTALLTVPDNLVFGIRRDVSLGIFKHERKRVWEYTWTLRVDYQIVEPDAAVIAYNAA